MKDKDDDFLDDFYRDEMSTSRTPANNEGDTLRERLNPENEIRAFKLALMGAYEVKTDVIDEETQENKSVVVVKKMKNFKPIINKQGVEEVTDYLKNLVNAHTFQSNFLNKDDYNSACKFTFNMMAANFIAQRRQWSVKEGGQVPLINIRMVYAKAKNVAKLGLRRALNDAERGHLSDAVKETISTNTVPQQKENVLQRVAGILK